jgi:ankyrin repeat protein
MKQLLEKGADVNTMANSKTPLHLVVKDRYPAGIELLIAKGANVNAHYGRERPLDVAIREGYYECEEILRKHHAVPSTSLTVAKAYSLAQSTGCQIL